MTFQTWFSRTFAIVALMIVLLPAAWAVAPGAEVVGLEIDPRHQPIAEQDLLRPLSKKALPGFDQLTFHDAPGVVDEQGQVLFVPVSAGPQGLIVDTEKVPHVERSWKALFDPKYKGEVAIEGDESLTPIGEAALAMGFKKPMELTAKQIGEVTAFLKEHKGQFRSYTESDSDTINLLKSGEIVLADGGRGSADAANVASLRSAAVAHRF